MRASDTHLMAPRTSQPLFAGRFSLLERLPGQEATYGEALRAENPEKAGYTEAPHHCNKDGRQPSGEPPAGAGQVPNVIRRMRN